MTNQATRPSDSPLDLFCPYRAGNICRDAECLKGCKRFEQEQERRYGQ